MDSALIIIRTPQNPILILKAPTVQGSPMSFEGFEALLREASTHPGDDGWLLLGEASRL